MTDIGRRLLREEDCATATEYAVILALVLIVILAAVTLFGENLRGEYKRTNNELFE